ncbi:DUF7312 domain-containing protein [Halomarina oriensis]|uniref:DUF7312 domain-containing protein n=1 Tax=Halomarina oriensis TaxID=671145 RepID=A0A6B0GQ17_9EURY|nr:hypothetical protein [Halomarina oriensis]MWG35467.1 hypothetical protein [Halomarina oriensis]
MSDDDEWRFSTDEVGPEASTADERRDSTADGESEGEGVLGRNDGAFADPEPQPVTAENAFFVLVGAVTMVGIFALLVV